MPSRPGPGAFDRARDRSSRKREGLAIPRVALFSDEPIDVLSGLEESLSRSALKDFTDRQAFCPLRFLDHHEEVYGGTGEEVVIGDPIHMSGKRSPMSVVVSRLRDAIADALGDAADVALIDERLTSAAAEASLRDAGLRWWQFDKGRIDALSAMALVRDRLVQLRPGLALDEPPPPEPPQDDDDPTSRRARRKRARKRRGE